MSAPTSAREFSRAQHNAAEACCRHPRTRRRGRTRGWRVACPVCAPGVADRQRGLGRRLGAGARPDAPRLDGCAALRLPVSAPGRRQPVGLADPLPDRCRRRLGWLTRACGCAGQGRPPIQRGDQEPVRPGNRHVRSPLAVPHLGRLGPACEGPEQSLEGELQSARRRRRDLVAPLYLHPELEDHHARRRHLRPWRAPGTTRPRPACDLPRRHAPSRPRSAPTRRRRPACSTGRPNASAALRRRSPPTISTARPRESKTTSSAFRSLC